MKNSWMVGLAAAMTGCAPGAQDACVGSDRGGSSTGQLESDGASARTQGRCGATGTSDAALEPASFDGSNEAGRSEPYDPLVDAGASLDSTTIDGEVTSADATTLEEGFIASEWYPCSVPGECAAWPMPDSVPGAKHRPSYAATTDTITDNVTSLVWQRTMPVAYTGCTGDSARECLWDEAKLYCGQLILDGQSDWRLPSKLELLSIVDHTAVSPSIDVAVFGAVPGDLFWTATLSASSDEYAYAVLFSEGGYSLREKRVTSGHVRCVRGGPAQGVRFAVDRTQNLVQDLGTGLVWQREPSWPLPLRDAKEYCAYARDGWRLPTIKELATIAEPSNISPALDFRVFIGEPFVSPGAPEDYWSATPFPDQEFPQGWYIDFRSPAQYHPDLAPAGEMSAQDSAALAHARCVR